MTLVTTVAAPWGIWQCSDHRLTVGDELYDDWSAKHVVITCPNGDALLAYTGVGEIGIYTKPLDIHPEADVDALPSWLVDERAKVGGFVSGPTSEWVLEALSGESRSVADSVDHLCRAATAAPGFRRSTIPTAFVLGAYVGSQAFFATVANGGWIGTGPGSVTREESFRLSLMEVNGPGVTFAGAHGAVTQEDRDRLVGIIQRPPRDPLDYFELLADVNRRAARNGRFATYVSEHCTISYLPPERGAVHTHVETWGVEPPPDFVGGIEVVAFGVNLHRASAKMPHGGKFWLAPTPPSADAPPHDALGGS